VATRRSGAAPGRVRRVVPALYEDTAGEDLPLHLTTALRIPAGAAIESDCLATIDLPAVERAATTVVHGAPDRFPDAFRALHEWIDRAGDQATSFERELYIDCDGPRDTWVTELQTILEPDRSSAQGGDHGPSRAHAEMRTE